MNKTEVNFESGRKTCRTVQLWALGPFWAEFNVGSCIESYAEAKSYVKATVGKCFAWGEPETEPKNLSNNITENHDIATSLWGTNWRMPTQQEMETLLDEKVTVWEWCDGSDKQFAPGCELQGYKISGKTKGYEKESIFLPAAGFFLYGGAEINNNQDEQRTGVSDSQSRGGDYWTGTPKDDYYAYNIYFNRQSKKLYSYYRKDGLFVRPVMK